MSSIAKIAVLAVLPCISIARLMFLGNNVEIYMSSVFTVTYTIFLLLILEVFNALLALKPNLKEVTEAISPFDFVFRFSTMENLYKYKEEVVTRISNKNTKATFTLMALGHIRIVSFTNILVHNSYETIFSNIPSWFCQNTKYMLFSCANGSGGYGGEVSECHFDPGNRVLKFYPNTMNGSKEIELTGQCISVSLETI